MPYVNATHIQGRCCLAPLVWLANHLARRGVGLRAGDVVTTGSITPTRFPHEAETCRWGVEGLGFVELNVK